MTTKLLVCLLLGFGFVALIRLVAELVRFGGIWGIALIISAVLFMVLG